MKPTCSIILCTRNRVHSLRQTLASIRSTFVPQDWAVELLIVDNGSTDSTREMVFSTIMPNMALRYIYEARKGKGHAYNSGMAAAQGDVFLFTDDDVRVPVNWIDGMIRPILDRAAFAVQGGVTIAPHLERPWLTGALRIWVACVDDPNRPPEGLVGANMAFAREAVELTGGFDPRLGPGAAGFYDDTLFGWKLQSAGKKILYNPLVAVEHHFAPDRLTLRSYLSTARNMAMSRAIVLRIQYDSAPSPSFFSFVKELPGLAFRAAMQGVKCATNRGPDAGFVLRYYEFQLWRTLRMKFSTRNQLVPEANVEKQSL